MKAKQPKYVTVTVHFSDHKDLERVRAAAKKVGVSVSAFIVGEAKVKAEEVLGIQACPLCKRAHAA